MEDMVGDPDSLHSCSDLSFFLAFSMVLFYFGAAPLVFFRLTYTPPDVSKRNDITTIVHFANPVPRLPFARAQLCCGVPKSKNITSKLAFKPHRRDAHSARSWSHGIFFTAGCLHGRCRCHRWRCRCQCRCHRWTLRNQPIEEAIQMPPGTKFQTICKTTQLTTKLETKPHLLNNESKGLLLRMVELCQRSSPDGHEL